MFELMIGLTESITETTNVNHGFWLNNTMYKRGWLIGHVLLRVLLLLMPQLSCHKATCQTCNSKSYYDHC